MRRVRMVLGVVFISLLAGLILTSCSLSGPGATSGSLDSGGGTTARPTTSVVPSTTRLPSTTSRPSTTLSPTTTLLLTTTIPPTTTTIPSVWATVELGTNRTRLATEDKVVALTFDGAYNSAPLNDILAALAEAGADATFFLTGEFVRDFPRSTQQIMEAGYPIGNHSYSHPHFTELSEAAMRKEIDDAAAALVELGAADPRPLFRAPYGDLDKQVLSVLGDEGYVSVYWTIDAGDWEPERTPEQVKARVLSNLQPGAIIGMHVGSTQTAQVLPELLSEIAARGYSFVSLREALPTAAD